MLGCSPSVSRAFAWLVLVVTCGWSQASKPDGTPEGLTETPEGRIAHDLGLEVLELSPLFERIPREILSDVGKRSSISAKELESTVLYRGVLRGHDGAERACELAVVQLAGPARGGRITFALQDGRPILWKLWGAHDFDDDPTKRWSVFLDQFSPWEGEPAFSSSALSARAADDLAKRLEKPRNDEQRLGRALLRQRLAMRANGFVAGLRQRKLRPKAEWLPELRREMEDVAELSREFVPLLGADGAARHEELARELAAAYRALEEFLRAEPEGDTSALEKRVFATCAACHEAKHEGVEWTASIVERRAALGLSEPALQIGYDLAPAFGDDGATSREIAQRFRAGVLLLEAAGK